MKNIDAAEVIRELLDRYDGEWVITTTDALAKAIAVLECAADSVNESASE
jgi:hypothetical protein